MHYENLHNFSVKITAIKDCLHALYADGGRLIVPTGFVTGITVVDGNYYLYCYSSIHSELLFLFIKKCFFGIHN